jgi:hypothetical protein
MYCAVEVVTVLLRPCIVQSRLCTVHYTVQAATVHCIVQAATNCTVQAATVYCAVEAMHSAVEAVHCADWNCVLHSTAQAITEMYRLEM